MSHQQHHELISVTWELDTIVQELRNARNDWRAQRGRSREPGLRELPSRDALQQIIRELCWVCHYSRELWRNWRTH